MEARIYTFEKDKEILIDFHRYYEMGDMVICPSHSIANTLKRKKDRTCRFCGLKIPDTKFEKEAHIISKSLGNRFFISDFECDKCNEHFAKLETNLIDFIGPGRNIFQMQTENKVKTFKSADRGIELRPGKAEGLDDGINLLRTKYGKDNFKIINKNGAIEISYTKNSFVPIKVYKALLKIALSVLTEEDASEYSALYPLLLDDKENKLSNYAIVVSGTSPVIPERPFCCIYKKRDSALSVNTHVVTLYFYGFFFVIYVPMHQKDIGLGLYSDKEIDLILCPLTSLVPLDENKSDRYRMDWINLSSNIQIKGEKGFFVFGDNSKNNDNEPASQQEQYDLTSMSGIYLVKKVISEIIINTQNE